ncbi:Hypothetical predicted protein [Olea europaea subsp. europaea]|uniref:Uncharacterized protein n=1 Tax=Olea europaea subsp. europaea TaxID=158383 RepID=A0A8S0SZV6_OLEEU|nr:Hypothetical predicted protein [Olea europaea subsp. europaea]
MQAKEQVLVWTYNTTRTQHDEIFIKECEYLVERTKEQQLLEDLSWEKIPVDDHEAVINITMSVLSTKLGRQILGLGDGHLRDIHTSSSNVHSFEKELETKCATRQVADVARMKVKQMMQYKMKVVQQQLNSTLQS